MELLQLRYFFESAKAESFTRTAEKYKVPPTSVSAAIKRLEGELGGPLFHRSCNRITLNERGRRLQGSLRLIFAELDGAIESLTSASTDTREIRMLVRAMRGEITDRIIEYKEKHPHISFKTVFDFDDTELEKYDIIIDDASRRYAEYEPIELFTCTIRLRARADSPLIGKRLTLGQLSEQPFITIGENNALHRILLNACKRAGFVPNIVVQSNDIRCLQKCLEAGVGIGLGREYPRAVISPHIKDLEVVDFNETQTICAFCKKESAYGNVEHFLRFLKGRSI